MAAVLNVNTDAAVKYADKLERLNRSALPVAVRSTLNGVAFDHKKRTLLKVTDFKFENRKKTFFKKFSKVQTAQGFNVNSMHSIVGFKATDSTAKQAIEDLEAQEEGGKIDGRSFIPMAAARTSKSRKKGVQKKYQMNRINNRIRKVRKGGAKQRSKFIRTAYKEGKGGLILYGNSLFEVKSLKGNKIDVKPIYSFKKSRSITVEKTGFMRKSSMLATKGLEKRFEKEARRKIEKVLK